MMVTSARIPSPGFVSYCLFAAKRPFFFLSTSAPKGLLRNYNMKDVPINKLYLAVHVWRVWCTLILQPAISPLPWKSDYSQVYLSCSLWRDKVTT